MTEGELLDALYEAWTIIANAGMGATHDATVGWHNETPEWKSAAEKWRDERFFPILRDHPRVGEVK